MASASPSSSTSSAPGASSGAVHGRASHLVLADGSVFPGIAFGAEREVSGEVVFNTGMTGYVETLTDPSYRGQILVLTYPLQGNYGVPKGPFESERIQIEALVIGTLATRATHFRKEQSLEAWLTAMGVPAIRGVDTRALTRLLREAGTMRGAIVGEGRTIADAPAPIDMHRVAELVTLPEVRRYEGGERRVLLIDTGAKESIATALHRRNLSVIRAPFYDTWERFLPEVDAIMLPNGPGDPTDLGSLIERVRPLLDSGKPILGVCLGHQLLSLAAGASTYRLPYGHRSQNQPVRDVTTGRAYVTSQNHGYAVRGESLPEGFAVWFENLNDGTNEGMRHVSKPILSVQFHPEAASGPHDTEFVFDRFAELAFATRGAR